MGVSTLVIFAMNFLWFLAEGNEYLKPPLGTIFVNAIVGLLMTCFFTHLAWFGVMKKNGCCCLALCCFLGKPNLLVVAILAVVFGILSIVAVAQALGAVKGLKLSWSGGSAFQNPPLQKAPAKLRPVQSYWELLKPSMHRRSQLQTWKQVKRHLAHERIAS